MANVKISIKSDPHGQPLKYVPRNQKVADILVASLRFAIKPSLHAADHRRKDLTGTLEGNLLLRLPKVGCRSSKDRFSGIVLTPVPKKQVDRVVRLVTCLG